MFIAGFAMVKMDANTDNQIQVLSKTEMLTTHGGEEINPCQERSNVADGEDGPRASECNSVGCDTWITVWGDIESDKRLGYGYVWCMGKPNVNFDCKIWDKPEGTQDCAEIRYYWGAFCVFYRGNEWKDIEGVEMNRELILVFAMKMAT